VTCDEAKESISALWDGERISKETALHLGACEECRSRLSDYVQIGIGLRRLASLQSSQDITPLPSLRERRSRKRWWAMFTQRMLVPRFAVGLIGILVVGLFAGLFLVRAQQDSRWLELSFKIPGDTALRPLTISTNPKSNSSVVGFFAKMQGGFLGCRVRTLQNQGERVQLGVRTKWFSFPNGIAGGENGQNAIKNGTGIFDPNPELAKVPERQYWIEAGQSLRIPVDGFGAFDLTGRFVDQAQLPLVGAQEQSEPRKGELRIMSPVLLRDGKLLFNKPGFGASTSAAKPTAVALYIPHDGLYVVSPAPFAGAVQGKANLSQITFTIEGRSYLLLSGVPITSGYQPENVWVSLDRKNTMFQDHALITVVDPNNFPTPLRK
jgi:hypothetical protein